MALIQNSVIDVIEVLESGIIQVRQRNDIIDDSIGQIVASNFHRASFVPGSDVSAQPKRVQDIAAVIWTPEVISAYEAQVASHSTPSE
jgi:hypothetical protein